MHSELFEVASAKGFTVGPGDLGENITTSDIDLLTLPVGTTLAIGAEAIITLTGLRNPCKQIDAFQQGLLGSVALERGADGELKRLAGVMAVVVSGGTIAPGDRIEVGLPPTPHRPLDRV